MSQEISDTALLKSWTRRRDADAFRALTNRYGRIVFAASLRVLNNTTDAEDVTQECFEKLAATSRAPGDYLSAWLHRIATNRALDVLKARTRRTARETSYAEAVSTDSDPDWEEIYPRVDEAVNALPDKYRRAIVAHYLCEKTHDAIATQEGVTRSAVTCRLKRGLELLKTHLSKQGVSLSASVFAAFCGSDVLRAAEIPAKLASDLGRIALSGAAMPAGPAIALGYWLKTGLALLGILLVGLGATTMYRMANPDLISEQTQSLPAPMIVADIAATNPPEERPITVPAQLEIASEVETRNEEEGSVVDTVPEPDLSGHLTDTKTGRGITDALIVVGTEKEQYEVRTDRDGYYEFTDPTDGILAVVCREANGYLIMNPLHNSEDGGFDTPVAFKLFETRPDQGPLVADFQLSPGEVFRGRVVDEAGKPLQGVLVTAGADINQIHVKNTAVSDADGRVVISGFPLTQSLYIWADGEGITSRIHGPFVMPDDTERDLVLLPEAIIRGRVVDQAGRGLNDMRISPQFEKSASIREITTRSDESGNFEIRGLFPGTHIMRVVAKDMSIANSPVPRITIAAGEIIENLEFVCNVGSYVIAGRVINRNGEPIARARMRLRGAISSNNTHTDPDGFFEFNTLLYDTYRVEADSISDDYLPTQVDDIEAGTRGLTIVLQEAFQVSGVVVDDETGKPITDYEIKDCNAPRLMILDQRYRRQKSKDGAFSLRVNQIRTVRIAARAEGYLLGYVDLELNETTTHVSPQTIRLKRQPALNGIVRTQDGKPLEGALIFSGDKTCGNEPDNYASARTLPDGTFILPSRKLAHDFITVFQRGYPNAHLMLEDQHYAGTPLEVTLYDGTGLLATVTLNGEPLPNVIVRPLEGDYTTKLTTGEDGQAMLNSLEPGTYTILANAPWDIRPRGRTLLKREVKLEGGKHTDLDLDFFSGTASLSGAILGNLSSASLALVFFEHDTPQVLTMLVGFDGIPDSYLFSNLPAAPARLDVMGKAEGQTNYIRKSYELDFSAGGEITFDIDAHGEVTLEAHAPPLNGSEQVHLTVRYGSDPNAKSDFSSGSDEWISFCTTTKPQADPVIIIPDLDAGSYSLVLSRYRENSAGETVLDAEQVLVVELTQPNETVVFPDW